MELILENLYLELIDPQELIKNFNTEEEFTKFLKIDSSGNHIKDLECTLEVFKKEELYEYCILIKSVLEEVKLKSN